MHYQFKQSPGINFVIKEWAALSENYLKDRRGLSLTGSHIVISEIVFEEQSWSIHSLKKYETFKYLLQRDLSSQLKDYIPNVTEYKHLIQALNKKDRAKVVELANSLKTTYDSGVYFDRLFASMSKFMNSEAQISGNLRCIKLIVQQVYVEILLKGYDISEAKNFITNVLSLCSVVNDKLKTSFPIYLIPNKQAMDIPSVNIFVGSLNRMERIEYIRRYFNAPMITGYCIFRVQGLKTTDVVGQKDIFFVPANLDFVQHEGITLNLAELRSQDTCKDLPICVVRYEGLSYQQSAMNAFSNFERFYGNMLLYFNLKVPVRQVTSSWVLFDDKGEFKYFYYSSRNMDSKFMDYELTKDRLQLLDIKNGHTSLAPRSDLQNSIESSLYWHGQACLATNPANKLLFFWISIECLFNFDELKVSPKNDEKKKEKIDLMLSAIPSAMLLSELHTRIWNIYDYFYERAFWMQESSGIPKDLLNFFRNESGKSIHICDFMDILPELIKTERDLVLRSEFEQTLLQFTDVKKHSKLVSNILSQIAIEVQLLYRFRNLIVHNAYHESALLPYFTWLAGDFAGVLLRSLRKEGLEGRRSAKAIQGLIQRSEAYQKDLNIGKITCFDKEMLNDI